MGSVLRALRAVIIHRQHGSSLNDVQECTTYLATPGLRRLRHQLSVLAQGHDVLYSANRALAPMRCYAVSSLARLSSASVGSSICLELSNDAFHMCMRGVEA